MLKFIEYIKSIVRSKNFLKYCGDVLAVLMPISLLIKLQPGARRPFITKFIIVYFSTYILKFTINSPRPDLSNNFSFPSAHMVSSFMVAHYYNTYTNSNNLSIVYSLYLLSFFVGYTRIKFNKHFRRDIIGAILIVLALNPFKP